MSTRQHCPSCGEHRWIADRWRSAEEHVTYLLDCGHMPIRKESGPLKPFEPADYYDTVELTFEQRKALPAIYHRPYFDGLGTPNSWLCEVCWDEGEVTGWPCAPALAGGIKLAQALGVGECH